MNKKKVPSTVLASRPVKKTESGIWIAEISKALVWEEKPTGVFSLLYKENSK